MDLISRRRTSLDRRPGRLSLGDGLEPMLHLLHHELYVASIPKTSLSRVSHSLLQLLLRLFGDSEGRRNHFFSFIETTSDYSVIMDEELLQVLIPKGSIEVEESKWRPLVIEVGALGSLTGISKIAASIIAPLADQGITVFCLSTNQDDYVMVKESNLGRALKCLSKSFRLVCDSDAQSDISCVQAVERRMGQLDSPPARLKMAFPECRRRPIVHPFICSSNKFSICSIVPTALHSIGTLLLDLMFFNQRSSSDDMFFSLSVIDEDISMVVDNRDINKFPEDSLYLSEGSWRLIRIGDGPLGFEECGIVAQVSAPLAQAGISMYYICSYCNDHTLVPDESVEKALQLFNERYEAKCVQNGHKCAMVSDSALNSQEVIVNGTHT